MQLDKDPAALALMDNVLYGFPETPGNAARSGAGLALYLSKVGDAYQRAEQVIDELEIAWYMSYEWDSRNAGEDPDRFDFDA